MRASQSCMAAASRSCGALIAAGTVAAVADDIGATHSVIAASRAVLWNFNMESAPASEIEVGIMARRGHPWEAVGQQGAETGP